MLEYFAYKKYKQKKGEEKQVDGAEKAIETAQPLAPLDVTAAGAATPILEMGDDAISPVDEAFLTSSLERATEPVTLRKRIASLAGALPSMPRLKKSKTSQTDAKAPDAVESPEAAASEDETLGEKEDPDVQQTQIMKLLSAFNLSLTPSQRQAAVVKEKDKGKGKAKDCRTLSEKLGDTFRVQAITDNTKELLADFMQILKDIQSGGKLTGKDLKAFFDAHAKDLKAANDSVPGFVKTLVLKLLPISAIPKMEDLAKPGALMSLIKSVLQVLKTKFPAFVGGSVLSVLSVLIVLLAVWHAYTRGRDERLAQEQESMSVAMPASTEGASTVSQRFAPAQRRELVIDGVATGYYLDEDGMKIPVESAQ
ncbi:hypothetical protein BCR37DRAFT_315924 [Protomyces lactucae-debilis]|uniref:Uncharacterized protein n=1 Tax=Protomyces lactucae-debilis TaxID=2754530 RepID=A0A1Y2FF68_PROLT|nr:uncharacterized protein BCR37DRAFT_315924 [Protomyces lactucae-debilis]ORY82569.1 hypothetical protein BCR37DRAFT_315924 [Protomyces lactucae-debilis]